MLFRMARLADPIGGFMGEDVEALTNWRNRLADGIEQFPRPVLIAPLQTIAQ